MALFTALPSAAGTMAIIGGGSKLHVSEGGGDGASISSGTLTINGSGFGSKATAAPMFFNDLEAVSDGAAAISAGIGLSDLGGDSASQVTISTSRAHTGTKALRCIYPTGAGGDMFPRVGNVVSPGSDRVYMAQWVYYEHTTGSQGTPIFKWARAGSNNGGTYSGVPRFYETIRPNSSGSSVGSDIGYVNNDFGTYLGKPWHDGFYTEPATAGGWHFLEYVGLLHPTAGIFQQKVKGVNNINDQVYSIADVPQTYGMTADAANDATFDWAISVFDGNDGYGNSDAWTIWADDPYVDRSLARVILTNNATYSSSTDFCIQPPLTWSNTTITATYRICAMTPGATGYFHVWDNANAYIGNYSAVLQ